MAAAKRQIIEKNKPQTLAQRSDPISPGYETGHRWRLREKFLVGGLKGFLDYEIIELLLTLGTPRRDCRKQAKEAIITFAPSRLRVSQIRSDSSTMVRHGRIDNRRAYTLVEMLMSITLTLFMMAFVVKIFGLVGNSVENSRAVLEMNERLRSAASRLRMDLEGATADMTPEQRRELARRLPPPAGRPGRGPLSCQARRDPCRSGPVHPGSRRGPSPGRPQRCVRACQGIQ